MNSFLKLHKPKLYFHTSRSLVQSTFIQSNMISRKPFCSEIEKLLQPDFTLSEDFETAKKQVYWRIRNIGQREFELLIGDWWEANQSKMGFEEIKNFNKEILEMDNPSMNRYFVQLITPEKELFYTRKILNL
mmetsp:Transcript_37593/g.39040  ORF Transcript_37593/g.39040 Transcript_37593/m.39040 type:complete len:132 (+) Transcript_37593:12-407(+)